MKALTLRRIASAHTSEYKYVLELQDGSKIYTNDEQFMLKVLEKHTNTIRNPDRNQQEIWKFMGELETTYFGKRITHKIFEGEKSYKITSNQSKNPAIFFTVAKEKIENVYYYLKKSGRKLSASAIENALHINATTIHNACKVLRCEGKVGLDISRNKRQYLYEALR